MPLFTCIATALAVFGCSRSAQHATEIKRVPLDTLDGLITESSAQLDKEASANGKGSLRITVKESTHSTFI
ncbi:MAG: hypothetical protein ABSA46_03310 [Thermodesulfovibrionales bacterium]